MILEGKSVLVAGGTGSLGQILVRRILGGELGTPGRVIVFSRDEAKQHTMRLSYLHRRATTDEVIYENFDRVLQFRIGDIRRYEDISSALRDADIVLNAAALKQVPTCEYFPEQAFLTNCVGATNMVRAIGDQRLPVEVVVGISTDKACKPVNVMGMTKAIQERIIVAANVANPGTRLVVVRYGNVLASRGSVIPLFHEQIRRGDPVTVTTPEMTRFLLSLDQAVDVVFAALREANRGETYVPKCPAASVLNIARALIDGRGIEIVFTGARPGEKTHEVLISEEEIRHTQHRGDWLSIAPMLPELATRTKQGSNGIEREFTSATNLLSLEETAALLERHGLLIDQEPTGVYEGLFG